MTQATTEPEFEVDEAVGFLLSEDHVEVAGHADADGVASAALLCIALEANGVGFRYTPLQQPASVVDVDADVYCDLGASYADELTDCVVVDHHEGPSPADTVVSAVDAARDSTAEIAYEISREMDVDRPDIALVGARGDDGEPEDAVERAVELDLARETGRLKLDVSEPADALAHTVEPYTRLSGDYSAASEFVDGLDVAGGGDEDGRLETAVTLLAAEEGDPDAVEELTDAVELRRFGWRSASEVARTVEACGRTGDGGAAFSVVYGGAVDEGERVRRAFESGVASAVEDSEAVDEGGCTVVRTGCRHTSAVADVYRRWVDDGLEEVAVVDVERGRASLRSQSLGCASVARELASRVDGSGGGHESRAGVEFPVERGEDFLEALSEVWR